MEKYVILEKSQHNKLPSLYGHDYYMKIIYESTAKCERLDFWFLLASEYWSHTYDSLRAYWSDKGCSMGFDYGVLYMLDEPSGFIYSYSGIDYLFGKDMFKDFEESLTVEQQEYYKEHEDEYPYEVDFFREGKEKYYCTMHKSNFFELFLAFDVCAKADKNYAVWYEDYKGWVHLKGFDTQEQAHEFVAHN